MEPLIIALVAVGVTVVACLAAAMLWNSYKAIQSCARADRIRMAQVRETAYPV